MKHSNQICAVLFVMLIGTVLSSQALARADIPAVPLPQEEILERIAMQRSKASAYGAQERVVVFRASSVVVEASGLTNRTEQSVVLVLTPAGGRNAGVMRFDYDPATSEAKVQSVRIFRKSGAIEEVDFARRLRDLPVPMYGIYWPLRMRLLVLPGLEPGDAVEWTVQKKGFEMAYLAQEDEERFIPPQRGHFFEILQFGDTIPVAEQWFIVSAPKEKPVNLGIYNGEVQSAQVQRGDRLQYRFWRNELPAFHAAPYAQALSDAAPKVVMTSLPDWLEKSRWFFMVSEPAFFVTPEIEATAREIVEGLKSDEERITALNLWVANNIRYSGLSLGDSEGYTIHPAPLTFDDRMGVCKDKAGMLVAMMRAVGYKETYAAMTMAGSRVEVVPADQFNHAVVAWRRPGGSWMLLDPTWAPMSRENWSNAEAEQHYLIGTPQGEELAITPKSLPETNPLSVVVTSKLGSDGKLTASFKATAGGYSETCLRRLFGYRPRSSWSSILEGMVQRISPLARLVSTPLNHDAPADTSKAFELIGTVEVPDFVVNVSEDIFAITPAAFTFFVHDDRIMENLSVVEVGPRNRGLLFRTAKHLEYVETLEFPWPVALGSDHALHVKNSYGELHSTAVLETPKRLKVQTVVRFTQRTVPKEGLAEYVALSSAVAKLRSGRLVVVKEAAK